MKKIKSKIFKILLVTTFVLPTIFTQNACSKKKDVEKYENEINKLKEEIKILEKFKSDLSHEFEPFKNLMHKYGVNNYNDLMKELTCLNDPNLQEQVLSLADCLLRTKTITFLKLQEKINDEQWWNENVEILKTLVIPFNLKSINDLKSHFTINKEIITFAEKISKVTDSDFIKHLEHEIDKLKIDIEHNNQELIPFYLEHLGDDNYTNWEGFIKQFDDLEWKEKNRAIIEKLAFALNCSFDEVNKQKIEQLDKDIKNNAKELLVKKKEKWDEWKNKLEQFEQDRKELIPFYLSQLWDESYTGWENFIKQFDDLEWKEKNKTIIERLAEVLGCNFDEVTKEKISQLEGEVRDVLEIIKNQGQLIDKLKELEKCKKEAILFYFDQLWDESYTGWDNFITQFDNLEWKEENKAIIENLAFALDCSFDEVNKQKIEQLDKDIKDKVQGLLNKRKEAWDNWKDKLNEKETKFEQAKKQAIPFYLSQLWDESYTDWDSFITQFDNLEWKEKNKAIIENLAFALNCSFDEINKQKIEQLDKDIKDKAQELLNKRKEVWDNWKDKIKERSLKWYEINQYKDGPIAICLGQLGGKNYIGWDNFIKQFDNVEWKEKNKEIIDILSNFLDCPNELIDSKRINNLDQRVKIIAQEILIEKCEVAKEQIEQKEKRFVSCKNNLIGFCFEQLWDENYTSWENFIKQFDDSEWKEKNKKIIEKLAKIFGCDYSAINHQKIADLDQITVDMVKKLFDEKRANKLKKKWEKNEKQFEQSKKELIAIYLVQLWDENYSGYSFFDYDYSFFDYINMFITKFDDQEWKRKNELIITKLASVLNCSNEEINSKKIDDLWDGEICTIMRNKLKELVDEKKKTWNEWKEKKENEFALKEKQLEQNREEIISFYIAKLWWSIYVSWWTLPDMINHDNWMEFVTQFDDPKWKEKNKEIIRILTFALDCSFNEVNKGRIMKLSDEIKNNAKKILDEMKEIEHKLQNEFKFDKNELIAFYLYQLGKENYIGWDNFIKQFDDFNWKNKNKAIIENLAFALNCSFDEVNKQKIKQLGKDIKDKAQELLNKRIAMENENEFALKEKQLEQNKKKIISFYVAMLWEGSYSTSFCGLFGIGWWKNNWSEFVTQFDNLEWKEKNRAIIEKLAFALNCSFNEVNKQKIEQLDKDIKDEVQGLLNKWKEAWDNWKSKLNEKETKFEQAKKEAIPFYLNQLWDESYKDWDNFITQFDNLEWKEKNKAIIENLAFALNCSFDEVNKQKIEQLDKDIKDEVQGLLNKRIAMENENEFALKEKQLEQSRKEIISFYIAMLWDDIYNIQHYFDGDLYFHDDNWPEFVKQFDNLEWKGKNKAIIEKLASALNCSFYKINKQKIEQLDKDIKDKAQELLNKRKEVKSKEFEQHKKNSIPYYIVYLADENYTNWDEFIKQFDDHKWKEKNKEIIQMLALAFGCDFNEINKQKIEQLDKDIKDEVKKLLDKKKKIFDVWRNKLKQFDQNKKENIPFYLNQLGDENYAGWDNFITQFDNLKWKEKNKTIIVKLASALNCSFDEINKQKIEQLDKNIKDKAQELLYENREVWYSWKKKKIKQLEKAKEELIVRNLVWLWNENYTDWKKISKKEKDAWFSKNWSKSYVNNNWKNFISMFDDSNWKEKNKEIIKNLSFLLNCSSEEINNKKIADLNLWYEKNGYDPSLKIQLANELRELYIKEYANENEFALKEKQLEQSRKEIISFYIAMLWDDIYNIQYYFDGNLYFHYDNWPEFVKQFDNLEWKEKNKTIIEKLAFALNCSFDEVNKQKIGQLDKDIKDEVKKMLDEKEKIFDVWKDKLNEKETKFEQAKKEAISFYLSQLWDGKYTNWENFIKQFDDLEWKGKNKAIIQKLASALNCSFDEINKQKIEQLDKDIKDEVKKLLDKKKKNWNIWKGKRNEEFVQYKKEIIPFYIELLGDENYVGWDNFITQFDDLEWKGKNKAIIEKLASALNCSFYKINKQKIEQLDNSVKYETQKLLDEKKIIWNWRKQTLGLKEEQFENDKKELTIFCLDQLGDENYTSWDNFIEQFDDSKWKEVNKTIIKELAWIWGYDFDEITKQVINQIDQNMKNETRKILDNKKNMREELLRQKARQFEQSKEELIVFYLNQLSGKIYVCWDEFINQFDDLEWKLKEENLVIITKLASFLNCSNEEINGKKIDGLNKKIKNKAKILLNTKYEILNKIEEEKNLIKQFEYDRDQLIVICFKQLWRKNQIKWKDFLEQFDDSNWKEKNKTIIENLAFALNCSFDEINKQKIDNLIKTYKSLNLDKLSLDNNEKILSEEEKEKFEQSKKELIAIYLVQLWDENYSLWSMFITKFDDQEWKRKNELIITKLASVLNCSNEEINSKKIDDLDEEIKNEFESLIKTNDLNNLLRMNSIKNENLKQNFNKMNDLLKRINVMYKLCYISLEIYTSLADEKIEQKTTISEILEKFNKLHETNKTKVDQTLIKQEKMMRLLYNLMQKLNTQNVGTLIEKINNWLELLKFIIYDNESKKFDELINIFEDDEESWSENVEKDMFNELAINNDWYSDPS